MCRRSRPRCCETTGAADKKCVDADGILPSSTVSGHGRSAAATALGLLQHPCLHLSDVERQAGKGAACSLQLTQPGRPRLLPPRQAIGAVCVRWATAARPGSNPRRRAAWRSQAPPAPPLRYPAWPLLPSSFQPERGVSRGVGLGALTNARAHFDRPET
eukprot:173080-Chlamydomonas_euryale.AAC.2